MLKSSNYTILGIILLGIICRLSLESFEIDWSYTPVYLSFLSITASYYGIYSQRQNSSETFTFMMDFKGAAQGGALFAIGYGAFTYVFYKLIHPHFLETFITTRKVDIQNALVASDATQETIDAAISNFMAFADMIYVPGNLSIITITSLTFLSFFYAFIFALITNFFPKFINQ
jgi:hypothetical protein